MEKISNGLNELKNQNGENIRGSEEAKKSAETYGFSQLDELTVAEIKEAEKEIGECARCLGNECPKETNRYLIPEILNLGGVCRIAQRLCAKKPKMLTFSQIPAKYAGKTFEDYEVTEDNEQAVKGAKWFIGKPVKGLYYYGEVGTGKTFLASLIAKEYVSTGKTVIFGDVPSLLTDLKATFEKGGTEDLLARYSNCDLLVLDDLGSGQLTEWNIGVVYQILNNRYNASKGIIVTSNYDLDGLEEKLSSKDSVAGKRIASRLREMTYQVCLGEIDRRN